MVATAQIGGAGSHALALTRTANGLAPTTPPSPRAVRWA